MRENPVGTTASGANKLADGGLLGVNEVHRKALAELAASAQAIADAISGSEPEQTGAPEAPPERCLAAGFRGIDSKLNELEHQLGRAKRGLGL